MVIEIDLSSYNFYDDYEESYLTHLVADGNNLEELLDNCTIYLENDEEIQLLDLGVDYWYNEVESLIAWEYENKKYNGLRLVVNNK